MTLDDISEIAQAAVCPESFLADLNIGQCLVGDSRSNHLVKFDPETNGCSAFSSIKEFKDTSGVCLHTHGIQVHVGDIRYNIHNSQIIVMETWHFDDTVEYKRSDSRASRIGVGTMLAGPIVGAAIGLATSFGKGHKHVITDFLEIVFWDVKTKQKQWISLEYNNEVSSPGLKSFIEMWREEKRKNEEKNRLPVGNEPSGISPNSGGCLGVALLFVIGSVSILCLLV